MTGPSTVIIDIDTSNANAKTATIENTTTKAMLVANFRIGLTCSPIV